MRNENKSNFVIHLIYATSFLLGIIAIISYLVWSKYQTTIQHNVEIQQRAALDYQIEQDKKSRIISCLKVAEQGASQDWAAACKTHAQDARTSLNNCIIASEKRAKFISGDGNLINYEALYQNYVAQCKAQLETPNPNPNCLLPHSLAKGLNEGLEKAEKLCAIIS